MTGYGAAIFPQHAALLAASAVSPEVARERGYVSVDTGTRLKSAGFSTRQRQPVPGLLIPVHGTDGTVRLHQYRPDSPRKLDGRPVKYETPAGHRLCLDVPPRARLALADASVPLWITEGARKADAAVSAGLCCVALLGVQSWEALPDWSDVRLRDREVVVCFDSDVMTKPAVGRALAKLTGWLEYRGATVRHVILPEGEGGKCGLDDYLGAGHSAAELAGLAAAPAVSAPTLDAAQLDGAALLGEVHAALTRYVILPSPEAADAVALWIAATHAQPAWEHATRLVVKSPLKRCGKTRLQEVASELCHKPLRTTNISVAALVRSVPEDDPPTLILDEADSVFATRKGERSESAEDLRGILNSGHSRGWPYVRWDPQARQREECPTFAMALVGGIGDMPDTVEDRAVIIAMRRRAPGETVAGFRRRRAVGPLHDLRGRLHAWLGAHTDALADAEPDLPAEDRAADVWEPLAAVADLAGGDWPDRARKACQALTGTADDPDAGTAGERLLADLREVWREDEDQLFTSVILDRLCAIEEAPWPAWHRGEKLSPRGLANLLKPWNVKSRTVRDGQLTAKGYHRADLADSWRRYVTADTASQDTESARQPGDGYVTDDDSGSVTPSGQQLWGGCDAVTAVSAERLNGGRCTECGQPLDPVLAAAGDTTHAWCDPGPPMTAGELAAAGFPAELAEEPGR